MIRNKTSCICFAICMAAVLITGCGSRKAVDSVGTPGITTESETAANEMDKAMIQEDVSADEGQEGPGAMESSESPGTDKKSEAFGDDLMVAVANVDTGSLNTKDEKIVLGEGESRITFQTSQDGSIGIIEIKE